MRFVKTCVLTLVLAIVAHHGFVEYKTWRDIRSFPAMPEYKAMLEAQERPTQQARATP